VLHSYNVYLTRLSSQSEQLFAPKSTDIKSAVPNGEMCDTSTDDFCVHLHPDFTWSPEGSYLWQ